jgi:hypothetical protein
MPAPDPQTMAPRSGVAPACARRTRLLALALVLFSACLNPMPEEFPSNDEGAVIIGPGLNGGNAGDPSDRPTVPDRDDSGDLLGGADGSGGTSASGSPPATQPPPVNEGGGEASAPDAGVDAGASSTEAAGTEAASPEGETTP